MAKDLGELGCDKSASKIKRNNLFYIIHHCQEVKMTQWSRKKEQTNYYSAIKRNEMPMHTII